MVIEKNNNYSHKDSIKKKWYKTISFYAYAVFVSLIFILCLAGSWISFSCKKAFPLPNVVALVIGLIVLIATGFTITQIVSTRFYQKYEHLLIALISALSFVYILFAAAFYYFQTGWDAGEVIQNAHMIAAGFKPDELYYSTCPNNLFITVLFSIIIRIFQLLTGKTYAYAGLVTFQCFGVSLSGYLSYYSAKKLSEKKEVALLTWFLFLMLGTLSPWVSVPYTDTVGLIFLSLFLFLYVNQKLPCLLGIILGMGYYIKPTVIIPAIAISICFIPNVIHSFCTIRLNGTPTPHQRCERFAPTVR